MDNATAQQPPLTIDCLPAELLSHVFSFLHHSAPSDVRLHDQPDANILRVPDPQLQPLKAVSLVNTSWRASVLPLLFRNAVCYWDRPDLLQAEQSSSPSAIPLLPFVQRNNLSSYVESLTLVFLSPRSAAHGGDIGLYRRGDGSGHYGYSPDPWSTSSHRPQGGAAAKDTTFHEDSNWLWQLLFRFIDPLRLTVIASPRVLASLTARMLFLGDEWIFNQSHHILSLSRPKPPKTAAFPKTREQADTNMPLMTPSSSASSEPTPRPSASSTSPLALPPVRTPCDLFTIRPWTALLLNEGSSTQVYKTYEYFHRRPPSLLGALVGAGAFPNDEALVPPTLGELSYVGIFPLADHFNTLVDFLPRVERLFVQLVPRNDILKDRREMKGLDMDDLWAERNSAYYYVISKMSEMEGNWQHLQVLETGDAADEESWFLAEDMVGTFPNWQVERKGVFVRKAREDAQDT